MRTQEVAMLLNRSAFQISRYVKSGELHPVKRGKENIFDQAEVLEFARSRGIRVMPVGEIAASVPVVTTPEREVHKDGFFTPVPPESENLKAVKLQALYSAVKQLEMIEV